MTIKELEKELGIKKNNLTYIGKMVAKAHGYLYLLELLKHVKDCRDSECCNLLDKSFSTKNSYIKNPINY